MVATLLTVVSHKVQCLGPYLSYNYYVNDIPDLVNSKVKMIADDIKIYTQTTSFSDALSFQNDLDKLCGWAREWLLQFNIVKCEHLNGSNALPYEYHI